MIRRSVCAAGVLVLAAGAASAQNAEFHGLGDLIGNSGSSWALGVSDDGSTVVGYADSIVGSQAFRWRANTGMVGLTIPTDWFPEFEDASSFSTGATACSGNGDVVTGYVVENENGNLKGFRWTSDSGLVKLAEEGYNAGRDISADGSVIIGETYTGFLSATAFQWTEDTGIQGIDFSGRQSLAWGCSSDGSQIAGSYGAFPSLAFRWTEEGLATLGDIDGGPEDSGANAISGDGQVVVGYGSDHDGFQDKFQATRWTQATGMVGLGRLPGTRLSSAFGTDGDGSTVVGYCFSSGSANSERAFIWTTADGMRSLQDVLVEQGANLTGWRLRIAYAVSADGRTIVGAGFNPDNRTEAFIARLADTGGGCPVCAADFNQDGGIDGGDVEAFFQAWEAAESCGDVNQDGGIDGADPEAFFNVWEAGGC